MTSGLPGEGKSTIARNLAIVFREWGQRVAVVDADLRSPTLGKLFNVKPEQGLTDVLTGDSTLADAMMSVSVQALGLGTLEKIHANTSVGGAAPVGAAEHDDAPSEITILGAGPRPANPPAVLSASATQQVLDELLSSHDIVIIDSPPLLAVSDAIPLLADVDTVILVSRLAVTTKDSAERTVQTISRVPSAEVAGVVVNDLSGPRNLNYGYGYGYGDGYGDRFEAKNGSRK